MGKPLSADKRDKNGVMHELDGSFNQPDFKGLKKISKKACFFIS
ncbi:hypothetical protein ADIAL_0695 [Alkalibacterium sp. AK22]|nr:hypothetical protein ADIAL_0695 [Alkalibacterium sp. AK22]